MHTNPWKTVTCRPVLPMDTPDVLDLTGRIWDGHDYIPHVWGRWMADTSAFTLVAQSGSRVVGLYRLSYSGPGEGWLHGLRVDPDLHGQGIASRMHDYMMEHWRRHGGGVLRLGTSEHRLPVQHLCERTGFERVAVLTGYTAPALEGGSVFHKLQPGETELALHLAQTNPLSGLGYTLLDLGWEWASPNADRIAAAVASGAAYAWQPGEIPAGLLVLGEDDEGAELFPVIQWCVCAPADLAAFLLDYRRLAAALGYRRADWLAPVHAGVAAVLQAAGFSSDWKHSLYLYEKK